MSPRYPPRTLPRMSAPSGVVFNGRNVWSLSLVREPLALREGGSEGGIAMSISNARPPARRQLPPAGTVADMEIGAYAFVPTSALVLGADGGCYLRATARAHREANAARSLHVRRAAPGYVIDVSYCPARWSTVGRIDRQRHVPVQSVVFGDERLR